MTERAKKIRLLALMGLALHACSGQTTDDQTSAGEHSEFTVVEGEDCLRDGESLCASPLECVSRPRSPTETDYACAQPCDGETACDEQGLVCRTVTGDYFEPPYCVPPAPTCRADDPKESCDCYFAPAGALLIRGEGDECEIVQEGVDVCWAPAGGCGDACIPGHWRYDLPDGTAYWTFNYSDSMGEGWQGVDPSNCPVAPHYD